MPSSKEIEDALDMVSRGLAAWETLRDWTLGDGAMVWSSSGRELGRESWGAALPMIAARSTTRLA